MSEDDEHGYRMHRLEEQRRSRRRRGQEVALYVVAGLVALAAVLGAMALAQRFVGGEASADERGFLAAVTFGARGQSGQPVGGLLLYDGQLDTYTLFVVPRMTLLTGPQGEYIFAGDVMRGAEMRGDFARLVRAKVDYAIDLPYEALVELVGGNDFTLRLAAPASLSVNGAWRTFEGKSSLPAAMLPRILSADGKTGAEEADFQISALAAAFQAAALQPEEARAAAVNAATQRASSAESESDRRTVLQGLVSGKLSVTRLPSEGVTNRGQFVYRPDAAQITAQITRRAPDYKSAYTVLVKNGSGLVGAGEEVVKQLAVLDANLPAPSNADSFDYGATQIVAGGGALPVAENVRAILGRGVVLTSDRVPSTTVVVIVGKDLRPKEAR